MTQTIRNNWRIAPWVVIALVLAVPLVAMQFTDEVRWMTAWDTQLGDITTFATGVRQILARSD